MSSEYAGGAPAAQPPPVTNGRFRPQDGCSAGACAGGVGTHRPAPWRGAYGGVFRRYPSWPPSVLDHAKTWRATRRPCAAALRPVRELWAKRRSSASIACLFAPDVVGNRSRTIVAMAEFATVGQ